MSRTLKKRPGHAVLPPGALPCVWMTAGLVGYKLCELDYDCEHCSFDSALAGRAGESERPRETLSVPPSTCEFPLDRRYHRTHGWAVQLAGKRVRLGLDAFAARLLDLATSVVLPSVGSHIRQGRAACWVRDDGELLPLCAPVSGTVLQVNRKVQSSPALILASPYEDGWLLEAQCDGEWQRGLVAGDEQRQNTLQELSRLHQRASRGAVRGAEIGPTLADGGQQLTELRQILGRQRYHRQILTVLG